MDVGVRSASGWKGDMRRRKEGRQVTRSRGITSTAQQKKHKGCERNRLDAACDNLLSLVEKRLQAPGPLCHARATVSFRTLSLRNRTQQARIAVQERQQRRFLGRDFGVGRQHHRAQCRVGQRETGQKETLVEPVFERLEECLFSSHALAHLPGHDLDRSFIPGTRTGSDTDLEHSVSIPRTW